MMRVTLRTLKQRPELGRQFEGARVRIWSGEHCAWWLADRSGYTIHEADAGIYGWREALDASHHCGPEKKITYVAVTP